MISSHAIENGFFSARFVRSELSVDLENQQANVDLMFDPGERYRFGQITISPLEDLSEGFLSRFLTFEPGDQYSSEDLIKLRQNYNNSQYFNQIAVTPQFSVIENQQIPVTVDLVPIARRAYSTGAGVSTDNGPRFRLNYEDRYINRRGHRLNGDLAVSTLLQEPSVSYVIPLQDPVNDSLRIATGFQRQETDSYISSTMRAGVTWRSLVWDNWVQNVFINYQSEKAELTNVTAESRNIQTRTNSTISGVNLARTRTDDPINPTNGWRLFAQASGSHESLLSDISFAQLYGSAKMIRAIGPGRLLLRAEIATTVADELLELPVSVRFFTGGDQSVRGFQYGELGDTNDLGEVVGGKHLLVGSIEYDYRIYGGWSVAAFVDTGNSFGDFGKMALKESAGLGVRWLSPIGPIRFDVAKGLDSGGFRFHITMGPDL
jgi:translocation and assembly module TamA